MDEDHVIIEKEPVKNCKGKNEKNREIYADQTIGLLLVIIVIESEIISICVSTNSIYKEDNVGIKYCHYSIPTYHFIKHSWHAAEELFTQECKTNKKAK